MPNPKPQYPSPPAVRRRAKELRWPLTPAEAALWAHLSNKQLHQLKFRRQHPLHHFILDFYCHAHRLVVEIDGGVHRTQKAYDAVRTDWLEQHGFKVLRFDNQTVLEGIEEVLRQIAQACGIND
jgi:very-short-patch-repair endonuclease